MRLKMLSLCVLCLPAAAALSGCGFTPLYATDGSSDVAEALRSIGIKGIVGPPAPARHFEEALEGRLIETAAPRYLLSVKLTDRRRTVAATSAADNTRENYTLRADMLMTDTVSGETRFQRLESTVGFGVVDSQYSSLIGREDAVRRAANELARKVEFDIALYLGGQVTEPGVIDTPDAVNGNFGQGQFRAPGQ